MENYLIERLVAEMASKLIGEAVGRIFEPTTLELAIAFRSSQCPCLFFSLNPARPALFLTTRSFKSLEQNRGPGAFTNLLRKYLANATLIKIDKELYERRIEFQFNGYDVIGNSLKLSLLLELMGRSCNLHLFIDGAYLASLREIPNENIVDLSPLPKPNLLLDPYQITATELEQLLIESSLSTIAKNFAGFSPTLIKELQMRSESMIPYQALHSLLGDMKQVSRPQIYAASALKELKIGEVDPRQNLFLSYFPLKLATNLQANRFATLNEAADQYYQILVCLEDFQSRRNQLLNRVKGEISKAETLIKKLEAEATEFADPDQYRTTGDLILANLGTLHREGKQLFIIDYYHAEQQEIGLAIDESQSPQQLAEDYFKKYQRAKRGEQAVKERLTKVSQQLQQSKKKLENIISITTASALERLITPAPQIDRATVKPREKKSLTGMRRYQSSDGFEVLVGRSDAGNDQLTFQIAKPNDIWLHTADYPGSHVLIRNPQRINVPMRTIFEAAQLAAFFSKAKHENSIAVRYTERKNVSRPKKAKPGMALLTQFKTIMVPPLEAGTRVF